MPVSEEEDLQQRLTEEFELMDPGFAPVDAAIRQGRAIRIRRRAAIAGGFAAVAVLGAALPLTLSQRPAGPVRPAGSVPPTGLAGSAKHTVTVDSSHIDENGDAHFSGSVDGRTWDAVANHKDSCIEAFRFCLPSSRTQTSSVDLLGSVTGGVLRYAAFARADVATIRIDLMDGEQLTMRPVAVGTSRVALFEVPTTVGVGRVTGVDADGGDVAYSTAH